MSHPTREDLRLAFVDHRRKYGADATAKVLSQFGGLNANGAINLDAIPESKWAAAIEALQNYQPTNAVPRTLDEISTRAYEKWNSARRAPRE